MSGEIAVVMSAYGRPALTEEALGTLVETIDSRVSVYLADDDGRHSNLRILIECQDQLAELGCSCKVRHNKGGLGKAAAVNQMWGQARAGGAQVLISVDNDIRLSAGWLDHLVGVLTTCPGVGLAGLATFRPTKAWCNLGPGTYTVDGEEHTCLLTDFCPGGVMGVTAEIYDELGPLWGGGGDADYIDTEYSTRCHVAGYDCALILVPLAEHIVDPQNRYKNEAQQRARARIKGRARLEERLRELEGGEG